MTIAIDVVRGGIADTATLGRSSPSFREIFERMAPFVWRVLRRLGVRAADLPDVCQEVFVVVHRKLPDFDERRSTVDSWVYGICFRTASQYRRRAPQRREIPEAAVGELSVSADQDYRLDRKRARQWLDRALDRLEEADRAIFVLYEIEEQPMKQIAAELGYPVQTAYSRLHRARREVQKGFAAAALAKPSR